MRAFWRGWSVAVAAGVVATCALAQPYKYITIDDFTAGPWEWTLGQLNQIDHEWAGLDRRHCLFGERTVFLEINTNPNNTTLTYSLGTHEQRLSSPLQVGWTNLLVFGNSGTVSVDFSFVDQFLVDFYGVGGSAIPDSMTLTVVDSSFNSGNAGWNIRVGGVYFRKSNFPIAIDWKHITYMKLRQDFESLPNPTTYSATRFYARFKPGLAGPGIRFDPLSYFHKGD